MRQISWWTEGFLLKSKSKAFDQPVCRFGDGQLFTLFLGDVLHFSRTAGRRDLARRHQAIGQIANYILVARRLNIETTALAIGDEDEISVTCRHSAPQRKVRAICVVSRQLVGGTGAVVRIGWRARHRGCDAAILALLVAQWPSRLVLQRV